MKVLEVDPESPLFGYVRPGYRLVSINGREVADAIDYNFKLAEERVDMLFASPQGQEVGFEFEYPTAAELGLTLDDHKVRFCKNDCIFCFVHQQPQGMRRALYFQDEDYRLSFTHGNFVTLSNTTPADLDRIIERRLSPLYVSVHATDDTLRRCMLRNERLEPIVPRLQYLSEHGIVIHTQVVLCPGINDGEQLAKSIDDLAALHPGVESLAVVPVGLTRYRETLAKLRTYTAAEARQVVELIEARQTKLRKEIGSRFVWPADEFYIQAGLDFPAISEYEGTPQFENGVGMAREFLTQFNRGKRRLKGLASDRRAMFVTGKSAEHFLMENVMPYLTAELGLRVQLEAVGNRFWGDTVTVSGLLTGQDVLRAARAKSDHYDILVLPPNCLNNEDLFLDNMSLEQFRGLLEREVVVGQYNLCATVREVCQ
jgi:putative radical SAM enzyme (TIGR03279 family)